MFCACESCGSYYSASLLRRPSSRPTTDTISSIANERTFLGYLRTSLALAMLGVVIAQLYRLQHSESPDPTFGYFVLSKPISCIFHVSAICVAILGSVRFFRQQHAMAIGKIEAGGWEIMIIGVYVLLVSEQRQLLDDVFVRLTWALASAGYVLSPCWNYRIQKLSRSLFVISSRRQMHHDRV